MFIGMVWICFVSHFLFHQTTYSRRLYQLPLKVRSLSSLSRQMNQPRKISTKNSDSNINPNSNINTNSRDITSPSYPLSSIAPPSQVSPISPLISQNLELHRNFSLTKSEEDLFQTLRDFVHQNNLQTTIRVAGGWVRDKLLGLQGKDDIDLALDNMSGGQFAQLLSAWQRNGTEPLHYHVIQFNPTKSKHLETASMKYLNFDIDFCGLRTENYTSDSRIPNICYGSPSEDAHRRDLTINSLFYNINTQQIEDFTNRGLHDLSNRIISTPLPPLITLQDDPLRCLRVVRFASRYNFSLTSELIEACKDPSVHESLKRKVSSERIAQEVNLMITHSNFGVIALPLLFELNLLPHLIRTPPSSTLYRFFEPDSPQCKLNWRHLWIPLRPRSHSHSRPHFDSAETTVDTPLVHLESGDRDNSVTAWKKSTRDFSTIQDQTSSLSPLLRCVEENGELDCWKMCHSAVCLNLLVDYFPIKVSLGSPYNEEELKRLLRYASLTHSCHDIYHTNEKKRDQVGEGENMFSTPRRYLDEHGIKKSTMIPITQDICTKSLMLSNKDTEIVLRIHRAASSLKPIFQRTLLYLHNNNPSHIHSPLQSYHPSLLSFDSEINESSYRDWRLIRGTVVNRSVTFWGPLDRLSLGLILREIGANLFHSSLILACSELILESLHFQRNSSVDSDEIIQLLRREISNDSSDEKGGLDKLVSQSKSLIQLIEHGIEELQLSPEFDRPFVFDGHDVRKFLPHLPRSLYSEVIHEQVHHCLCHPNCSSKEMETHLNLCYPNYGYKRAEEEKGL